MFLNEITMPEEPLVITMLKILLDKGEYILFKGLMSDYPITGITIANVSDPGDIGIKPYSGLCWELRSKSRMLTHIIPTNADLWTLDQNDDGWRFIKVRQLDKENAK